MTCAAIMTANPPTILDSDSVADAAGKLVTHRATALPVVDANGIYAGMFGIRDLLSLVVPRRALAGVPNLRFTEEDANALRHKFRAAKTQTAGETADRRVAALHPDTPEIEALRAFSRDQATLPVVVRDTGKLVGVVSCWDAIRAISGT